MPYRVDTHVHCAETSGCSQISGRELAGVYARAGYDAIVVCDHYYDGFFKKLEGRPWSEMLDCFLAGYRQACEGGRDTDTRVLLGLELRLRGCLNDYLVFGVTEAFLQVHPRLDQLSLREAFELFEDEGLLLVQAHPFRPGMTPVNPRWLHGVEVFNGHPSHASDNEQAFVYACEHGLLMTGGSDAHFWGGTGVSGMVFDCEITSGSDLVRAIRSGRTIEIIGVDGEQGCALQPDLPIGRYRHFKGNYYDVIGLARHSEEEQELVVYRPLYGDRRLWVRPKSMFLGTVSRSGQEVPRFTFVG